MFPLLALKKKKEVEEGLVVRHVEPVIRVHPGLAKVPPLAVPALVGVVLHERGEISHHLGAVEALLNLEKRTFTKILR